MWRSTTSRAWSRAPAGRSNAMCRKASTTPSPSAGLVTTLRRWFRCHGCSRLLQKRLEVLGHQEVLAMPSTMPLRVGDNLLASAKLAADAAGRSAAQQIGYWAKLGRELERSGSVSVREVAEVLAGARSYDELDAKFEAAVRAEWDARIEARRAALNLAEQFAAEGGGKGSTDGRRHVSVERTAAA